MIPPLELLPEWPLPEDCQPDPQARIGTDPTDMQFLLTSIGGGMSHRKLDVPVPIWVEKPIFGTRLLSPPGCQCTAYYPIIVDSLPEQWQKPTRGNYARPNICNCFGEVIE